MNNYSILEKENGLCIYNDNLEITVISNSRQKLYILRDGNLPKVYKSTNNVYHFIDCLKSFGITDKDILEKIKKF